MNATVVRDRVVLIIEDCELRDMVEDYLTGTCDLQYEYLAPTVDGGEPIAMTFPPSISLTQIAAALNKLDAAEVERVLRLNNRSAMAVRRS